MSACTLPRKKAKELQTLLEHFQQGAELLTLAPPDDPRAAAFWLDHVRPVLEKAVGIMEGDKSCTFCTQMVKRFRAVLDRNAP